jgi:hypothetical protein
MLSAAIGRADSANEGPETQMTAKKTWFTSGAGCTGVDVARAGRAHEVA